MDTKTFEALWKPDGSVYDHAPAWAKRRADMRRAFPSPYRDALPDPLPDELRDAIQQLCELKPSTLPPSLPR